MQIDCEENTNLCSLFFYYKLRRSRYLFAGTFCRVFSLAHRAEWLQNLKKTKHCILKTSCFKDHKAVPSLLLDWFLRLRSRQPQTGLTSEVVEPSLLGSVMLNTVQVFFSVVHVVLEGSVTVVAEVSLPHGSGEILQPRKKQTKQKTPLQTHLKNTRQETLHLHFVCVVAEMPNYLQS